MNEGVEDNYQQEQYGKPGYGNLAFLARCGAVFAVAHANPYAEYKKHSHQQHHTYHLHYYGAVGHILAHGIAGAHGMSHLMQR